MGNKWGSKVISAIISFDIRCHSWKSYGMSYKKGDKSEILYFTFVKAIKDIGKHIFKNFENNK